MSRMNFTTTALGKDWRKTVEKENGEKWCDIERVTSKLIFFFREDSLFPKCYYRTFEVRSTLARQKTRFLILFQNIACGNLDLARQKCIQVMSEHFHW